MALKVLMLRKKLAEWNDELKNLRTAATAFQTREAELEKAIEEAKTEEEKTTVEEAIEAFEKDKAENASEQTRIEGEISKIESEIAEVEAKAPQQRSKTQTQRKDNARMVTRSYKGMNYDERSSFVSREDIKEFITRVREMKEQTRAVKGADLGIPAVVLGLIREDVGKYSKLIKFLRLKKVSGKARQNIAGSIPEGVWTEMIANFNEADISFNQIEVDGYKVGNYIPVPNSVLEDSSDIDLFDEIYEALLQGIGLAIDKAVLYGTGRRMLTGIVTRLAQTEKPSDWGANSPAWTDLSTTNILKSDIKSESGTTFFAHLVEALGVASSKYGSNNQFWVMNHKTHMDICAKALKITDNGSMVVAVGKEMPVIGGEIVELEFVPDYEIIGGYGSQYLLTERQGSTFKKSEDVRFLQDQTVFAAAARYDGKPVMGEGFVVWNYNNVNPTTSTVFQGDSKNAELVSLSSLTIGSATLFPSFDADTLNYKVEVSAHSNKISVTTKKSDATVVIKNGDTVVENGKNAIFAAGENLLTIEVTNGNAAKRVYTVVVMDSAT